MRPRRSWCERLAGPGCTKHFLRFLLLPLSCPRGRNPGGEGAHCASRWGELWHFHFGRRTPLFWGHQRERVPGMPAPGKLGGKEVGGPGGVTGGPPHPQVPGRRPPGQPGCQLSWGLGTRKGGTPGRLNRKFPRICTPLLPGAASGKIQAGAGEREGVPAVPGAGCGAPPWLCVGCKVL